MADQILHESAIWVFVFPSFLSVGRPKRKRTGMLEIGRQGPARHAAFSIFGFCGPWFAVTPSSVGPRSDAARSHRQILASHVYDGCCSAAHN